MLSAMGNLTPSRLLDTRYIDLDGVADETPSNPFPVFTES
jgi:hypothetical protein